jgi:aryl-alcohol dehydrogenase-like predicted oxidoreductase
MSADQALKMEYTRLGNSGLQISRVILGTMSLGSSKWQDWVIDEEAALPLLKHAYDVGLNTWDTADVYSNGESERIIGKAIKKYDIPRNRLVILSKCFYGVPDDGSQRMVRSLTGNGKITPDTVILPRASKREISDCISRRCRIRQSHWTKQKAHS